ncbi:YsnF/AvaK domain-containing protein [Ignavigranum ruoffiae]|uniref:YsnF/AvaK domain-containing protein n=1 Tax=Ignavigranum ruoffiae TaxID=89093 RepID=UPI0024AD2221|nr:YsnF/AvaK domain-containing protein [Ignavigranum ruoffiae]
MVNRFVYGTYPNADAADKAINELINRGVDPSAIHLAANPDVLDRLDTNINVIDSTELAHGAQEDKRSWFDKLFGIDQPEAAEEEIDYTAYQDSFDREEILVLVDSHYEADAYRMGEAGVDGMNFKEPLDQRADVTAIDGNPHYREKDFASHDELSKRDQDDIAYSNKDVDTETIRLHEERLRPRTVEHDAGEVKISKEVVEETQTVEVPVRREEVHITRTNHPTDVDADADHQFTEETIVVPVSEEEVVVDKDVVVTDELNVDRVQKTDYETVSDTTRREEINVDGDVDIEDEDRLNS